MKKRFLLIVSLLTVLFFSCIKEEETASCTPAAITQDTAQIYQYVRDSAITLTDSLPNAGLYWEVVSEGTGAAPGDNSLITVKYIGRLLTGQGFDSTYRNYPEGQMLPTPLGRLLEGWRLGVPKIKAGGRIKLIMASALAYGCNTIYGTLTNKPLFYDIELIKVEN